jgi:hypothetical protein
LDVVAGERPADAPRSSRRPSPAPTAGGSSTGPSGRSLSGGGDPPTSSSLCKNNSVNSAGSNQHWSGASSLWVPRSMARNSVSGALHWKCVVSHCRLASTISPRQMPIGTATLRFFSTRPLTMRQVLNVSSEAAGSPATSASPAGDGRFLWAASSLPLPRSLSLFLSFSFLSFLSVLAVLAVPFPCSSRAPRRSEAPVAADCRPDARRPMALEVSPSSLPGRVLPGRVAAPAARVSPVARRVGCRTELDSSVESSSSEVKLTLVSRRACESSLGPPPALSTTKVHSSRRSAAITKLPPTMRSPPQSRRTGAKPALAVGGSKPARSSATCVASRSAQPRIGTGAQSGTPHWLPSSAVPACPWP